VRRRFKIAFVILLVVTVVWALAWHQHIMDYKQMDKASEERFREWLEERERNGTIYYLVQRLRIPIWTYKYGSLLVTSGFIICMAWEFLLAGVYWDWRKDKIAKNEKVGWVVKILVTLASLVIFILYPIALFAPIIFFSV